VHVCFFFARAGTRARFEVAHFGIAGKKNKKMTEQRSVDPVDLDKLVLADVSLQDITPTPNAKNMRMTGRLSHRGLDGPLVITMCNLKTYGGIRTTKFGQLCMGLSLTPEQSTRVKEKLEHRAKELAVKHKNKLFEGLMPSATIAKLDINNIEFSFNSIVQEGKDNPEKVGEKYNDSMLIGVPSIKKNKTEVLLNKQMCQILDLNNNEFDWMFEQRADLEFVCMETKFSVNKEGKVSVRLEARAMKVNEAEKFKVNAPVARKVAAEDDAASPAKRQKQETFSKKPVDAFAGKLRDTEPEEEA
jgi:hypothetical protein